MEYEFEAVADLLLQDDSVFRRFSRYRLFSDEWKESRYQFIDFRISYVEVVYAVLIIIDLEFKILKEVFLSSEKDKWKFAVDDEFNSFVKNYIWKLVDLLSDRKFISCKWVFKLKFNDKGEIVRYKVRFVVRGFT